MGLPKVDSVLKVPSIILGLIALVETTNSIASLKASGKLDTIKNAVSSSIKTTVPCRLMAIKFQQIYACIQWKILIKSDNSVIIG